MIDETYQHLYGRNVPVSISHMRWQDTYFFLLTNLKQDINQQQKTLASTSKVHSLDYTP